MTTENSTWVVLAHIRCLLFLAAQWYPGWRIVAQHSMHSAPPSLQDYKALKLPSESDWF
jgi:hypothetical protein